jgi:hypothetical protein
MASREPVPDRGHGGDHPEQQPPGQLRDSDHDLWSRPSLTIAEAARLGGVSVSTIRRYLAAGRFPTAHQQSSPVPGQRGPWRIPTQELRAAGLRPRRARTPTMLAMTSPRAAEPPARLVMTGFESSSTPWRLSAAAAKPPRTWPPSGPARSRPWRAPWRRCRLSALPQPRPRPPQRHHRTQPTPPGRPSGQACCRWCQSDGRPGANSARRRRRPSSGGR